jgi:hypothetical protein
METPFYASEELLLLGAPTGHTMFVATLPFRVRWDSIPLPAAGPYSWWTLPNGDHLVLVGDRRLRAVDCTDMYQ